MLYLNGFTEFIKCCTSGAAVKITLTVLRNLCFCDCDLISKLVLVRSTRFGNCSLIVRIDLFLIIIAVVIVVILIVNDAEFITRIMHRYLANACRCILVLVCSINFKLKLAVVFLFVSLQDNLIGSCIKSIAAGCHLFSVQPQIRFSAAVCMCLFLTFLSCCPGVRTFITLPLYFNIICRCKLKPCLDIYSAGITFSPAADTC